jgi:hypothetical protein
MKADQLERNSARIIDLIVVDDIAPDYSRMSFLPRFSSASSASSAVQDFCR